ncbi:MAG: hypothetical protein ACNI3H_00545 [Halarcobacter ebronensis]|uniref:hypothetical protein n=1 Tax=Halarcobacter ebronensis TaxID=1462615 RepID=UPI003C76B4A7
MSNSRPVRISTSAYETIKLLSEENKVSFTDMTNMLCHFYINNVNNDDFGKNNKMKVYKELDLFLHKIKALLKINISIRQLKLIIEDDIKREIDEELFQEYLLSRKIVF